MKHVQRRSVCLVLLLAGLVRGQTVLTIDDFEYSDEAAVRDAWHPAEGSSPAGFGYISMIFMGSPWIRTSPDRCVVTRHNHQTNHLKSVMSSGLRKHDP
jgi:hypothetical protein